MMTAEIVSARTNKQIMLHGVIDKLKLTKVQ